VRTAQCLQVVACLTVAILKSSGFVAMCCPPRYSFECRTCVADRMFGQECMWTLDSALGPSFEPCTNTKACHVPPRQRIVACFSAGPILGRSFKPCLCHGCMARMLRAVPHVLAGTVRVTVGIACSWVACRCRVLHLAVLWQPPAATSRVRPSHPGAKAP
jgi:hypothetical protein